MGWQGVGEERFLPLGAALSSEKLRTGQQGRAVTTWCPELALGAMAPALCFSRSCPHSAPGVFEHRSSGGDVSGEWVAGSQGKGRAKFSWISSFDPPELGTCSCQEAAFTPAQMFPPALHPWGLRSPSWGRCLLGSWRRKGRQGRQEDPGGGMDSEGDCGC